MVSQVTRVFLLAACCCSLSAAAQSVRPDRIVLNITDRPSESAAVTWRTSTAVGESFAEIAPATPDPGFHEKARRYTARTEPLIRDTIAVHYHSIVFDGLQAGQQYVYRVGQGNDWSEWIQFRTAVKGPAPFTFIYLGDAQTNIFSHWSRTLRKAWSAAPDARLIIHAGDLVNRGNRNEEWQQWFDAGGFIHASIPGLMTPGNHEFSNDTLSAFWRPQYTLPQNGPAGLEETCYYTDVQGVRFISLNSEEISISPENCRKQLSWLEGKLRDNPNRWTCITFHHPTLSTKSSRDNVELRTQFKPLFDKYSVDLVLQGHDHTYARGRDGHTMYVVSVSGPKMSKVDPQPWMQRTGANTQLFQLVTVDGDRLSYRSYTATGDLFDAFELKKKSGAASTLRDIKPAGLGAN
ncbi:fibronectin type III domain-containing protein [Chitinophaga lutea]